MLLRGGGVLLTVIAAILAVGVIAAVFLGLGSGLAHVFAVSVWEATVVVLVVTIGLFWAVRSILLPSASWPEGLEEPQDMPEGASRLGPEFPWVAGRGKRRRRR